MLDLDKNLFTDFYKVSEIRENHDGEILTNYSEITEDSNKFILDPSIISNIVNKIEPGKLYIYTDVFGYQKGADNEKSINNFYVYHLFNNKSQINNKYNISIYLKLKIN